MHIGFSLKISVPLGSLIKFCGLGAGFGAGLGAGFGAGLGAGLGART